MYYAKEHPYQTSFFVLFLAADTHSREEVIVNGDPLLTYSIVSNLVKNAIEASPLGKLVSIHLSNYGSVELSIHNEGAVPEAIRDSSLTSTAPSARTTYRLGNLQR
ncbi:MAG TPA: ATP-binding protein [Sediminispirochaeta sp.]|nr:ATP-binding protein [Sediminispirochaeta sp.]